LKREGHGTADVPAFPIKLLLTGYGTACGVALILLMLGAGSLAVVLTGWLGGAVATLAWGSLLARSRAVMVKAELRGAAPVPAE
jgi:hypothetical protein